jgi:hypothetical protein
MMAQRLEPHQKWPNQNSSGKEIVKRIQAMRTARVDWRGHGLNTRAQNGEWKCKRQGSSTLLPRPLSAWAVNAIGQLVPGRSPSSAHRLRFHRKGLPEGCKQLMKM